MSNEIQPENPAPREGANSEPVSTQNPDHNETIELTIPSRNDTKVFETVSEEPIQRSSPSTPSPEGVDGPEVEAVSPNSGDPTVQDSVPTQAVPTIAESAPTDGWATPSPSIAPSMAPSASPTTPNPQVPVPLPPSSGSQRPTAPQVAQSQNVYDARTPNGIVGGATVRTPQSVLGQPLVQHNGGAYGQGAPHAQYPGQHAYTGNPFQAPMGGQPYPSVPVHGYGQPSYNVEQPQPVRGKVGMGTVAGLMIASMLVGGVAGSVAGGFNKGSGQTVITQVAPSETSDSGRPDGTISSTAAKVVPSVAFIEVFGSGSASTGSGFVISEDGYILTNQHVIADASEGNQIVVTFPDGQEEKATVVGSTAEYDIAVIKVERDDLKPLVLGDSDALVVGDPVIAIGAPLGLEGTVTTGIVSALNRPVSAGSGDDPSYINAIQTDAAINPGNSGGPLVNSAGQVIGINSAIAQSPSQNLGSTAGNIGLGFAISSNQAARTAKEIIETGSATYPIIGVMLDGQARGEGVKVVDQDFEGESAVTPGGPADLAGIKAGDVILAIDGRPVAQSDELIVAIRAKAPGEKVTLTLRDGVDGEKDVVVELGTATSEQ